MAIEEAITSRLSGVASGRSYWTRAEGVSAADGAYLTLNWIGGPDDPTIKGTSGYVINRLQIDVYAETYSAARTAMDAARAALDGFRGTVAGTFIAAIRAERPRDLDASDAGEVSHLFRKSLDLIVHYHE